MCKHELQSRSTPTIAIWAAAIWTTTIAVQPASIPSTAVRPAAVPSTAIWSATARLWTATSARLAHYSFVVFLFGSVRSPSVLRRKDRDRRGSTADSRRLRYLDIRRLYFDPDRQLHGQCWPPINQKLMKDTFPRSLGKVGFYILLPLVFIVVPTSWFESRCSFCLIRHLFGVPCPGCGMTRAISCVFHGQFKQALQYNKLVVIVLPLLCHAWLGAVMAEYKRLCRELSI